jgi:hypothetical protein
LLRKAFKEVLKKISKEFLLRKAFKEGLKKISKCLYLD